MFQILPVLCQHGQEGGGGGGGGGGGKTKGGGGGRGGGGPKIPKFVWASFMDDPLVDLMVN